MLDVTTVASRLGVSPSQVRGLIDAGRLVGVDVGLGKKYRRYKVPEDALVEFMQQQGKGILGGMKVR